MGGQDAITGMSCKLLTIGQDFPTALLAFSGADPKESGLSADTDDWQANGERYDNLNALSEK